MLTYVVIPLKNAPKTKLTFEGGQGVKVQITSWTEDKKNRIIYVTDGTKVFRLRFVVGHGTNGDTYESLKKRLASNPKVIYQEL